MNFRINKYLVIVLPLLLAPSFFINTQPVSAETIYCTLGNQCPSGMTCDGSKNPPVCVQGTAPTTVIGTNGTASPTAQAGAGTPTPTIDQLGDVGKVWGPIGQFLMSIFAWLMGVAALTLDTAVYYTIVVMADFVHNLSAIGTTWRILRDLGNILIIFGFLAIGISIILNTERFGWGKKMLPMLLISAIFLNFSLFFAQAVIDVGNLFATEAYTQINGGTPPSARNFTDIFSGKSGISTVIMNQLGLTGLYQSAVSTQKAQDLFKGTNPFFVGLLGIILFLVTAFTLFTLAFILLARFISLIFIMILAPIGFAGLAIPQLEDRAKQWWHQLFQQTLTAPLLLLMLYVALAVITDQKFLTSFGNNNVTAGAWLGIVNNSDLAGFAGTSLSFIVAIGLLLAVSYLAKSLSATGAGWATKWGGKLSFGAASFGLSLGGRATLGMAGNLLASKRMQSWARRGGASGLALKGVVLAGKGLRSSTYDFRNLAPVSSTLGAAGINAGKGAALTAKQAHDAQYGVKPVKEWMKHSREEREAAGREIDFNDAINDNAFIDEQLADSGVSAADKVNLQALKNENERIIKEGLSKMSTKQLEELGGIKKGVDALVQNLSPQQFEALLKTEKLDEEAKEKIKESRYHPLKTALDTKDPAIIKKAIGNLSKGELESVPGNMLSSPEFLSALSDKQRDTITDSKERTAAEKEVIRNSSPVASVERAFNTSGATVAGKMVKGLTPQEVAKLKKNILVDHDVIDNFTPAILVALQEEKKLSGAEIEIIAKQIKSGAGPNSLRDYINGVGSAYWA